MNSTSYRKKVAFAKNTSAVVGPGITSTSVVAPMVIPFPKPQSASLRPPDTSKRQVSDRLRKMGRAALREHQAGKTEDFPT
jgi:hypothetical protein